jgi:hypothetical protein
MEFWWPRVEVSGRARGHRDKTSQGKNLGDVVIGTIKDALDQLQF